MRLALFLAGSLIVGPVPAFTVAGDTLNLDPRETEMARTVCQDGKCTIIHVPTLHRLLAEELQRTYDAGRRSCGV